MRVGRTLVAGFAASVGIVVALSHGAVRAQSRPSRSVGATDPAALRSWDSTVDSMVRDGSLQLRRTTDDTLMSDRVHERVVTRPRDVRYGDREIDLFLVKRRLECAEEGCPLLGSPAARLIRRPRARRTRRRDRGSGGIRRPLDPRARVENALNFR